MNLLVAPPPTWDQRIASPMLSEGFAQASRILGFRPWYAEHDHDRALVLVRRIPLPVLDRLTTRAKVYVDYGDRSFVHALIEALAAMNVSHVKFGDERHGMTGDPSAWPRAHSMPYHVFFVKLAGRSDGELLAAMSDPVPRNIRKARRGGVVVTEITSDAGMDVFCALMDETSVRMRSRRVAAVYPAGFFRTIFRTMVPRGQALFLLAQADGVPLAAHMYLVAPDRLTYYHGASTRARDLTPKHGPTAVFWHAMRLARDRGLPTFDMGAGTPTTDPANVHFSVTDFKRRWGGDHVAVPSIEMALAPGKVFLQDHLLKPLWDRAHPLYLRIFRQDEAA
jgi:lipid II:glycine glycyltransferase (peptidoglycan interpeptide bridge formation enzyme)